MRDIGRERQREIFLSGLAGARPVVPTDARLLEARARAVMSAEAFAYVAGGAGLERTMDANRAAFDRWRIVPRMLRDVSTRDLGVELFGAKLPAPLLLAPIGVLEMAHREADLAVARAAAALGVPMIFSGQASVAKGILAVEDARRAVESGVNGVIVSNHGGRQVDGTVGALDALPDVCEAIDGRIPVLFDSGIRTGADVFKALALGARAVLLGRPYVYGLGVAGEAGVRDVVRNLLAEFDLTMGLAGCRSVAEITRDLLFRNDE